MEAGLSREGILSENIDRTQMPGFFGTTVYTAGQEAEAI